MKSLYAFFAALALCIFVAACGSINVIADTLWTDVAALAVLVATDQDGSNSDAIKAKLKAMVASGLIENRDAFKAKLDAYVAAGKLTQDQADKMLEWYDKAVSELSAAKAAADARAAAISKTATRK
jgi:hypothetical protein